jgi:Zn-dependent peptidase ImmA (M78 family)
MGKKVKQAVKELLERFGPKIPVDIEAIAEALNISVHTEDLEATVSGILMIKDGHAVVVINELHPAVRKRFTLAHEIGHYLLHRDSSKVFIDGSPLFFRDYRSTSLSAKQELEANTFAAELLMPASVLRDEIRRQWVDIKDAVAVRRLATKYGVSSKAFVVRLISLGLAPPEYY